MVRRRRRQTSDCTSGRADIAVRCRRQLADGRGRRRAHPEAQGRRRAREEGVPPRTGPGLLEEEARGTHRPPSPRTGTMPTAPGRPGGPGSRPGSPAAASTGRACSRRRRSCRTRVTTRTSFLDRRHGVDRRTDAHEESVEDRDAAPQQVA